MLVAFTDFYNRNIEYIYITESYVLINELTEKHPVNMIKSPRIFSTLSIKSKNSNGRI